MKDANGRTCLTRSQLDGLLTGAAAAGAPMLRDTVDAPATSPSSDQDDSGDEANATSTELQSEDVTLPQSDKAVDNLTAEEEIASESIAVPELEAANDNSPGPELAPTGTE